MGSKRDAGAAFAEVETKPRLLAVALQRGWRNWLEPGSKNDVPTGVAMLRQIEKARGERGHPFLTVHDERPSVLAPTWILAPPTRVSSNSKRRLWQRSGAIVCE